MGRILVTPLLLLFGGCLSACNDADVFTLYRSSVLDPYMRIHMATFDAKEPSSTYNQENCQIAAKLFMQQPGVSVRYWCELGYFKD